MLAQAANKLEQTIGHGSNAVTAQDVSQPQGKYAAQDGSTMKALTWQGKNTVQVLDVPKPAIAEPRDVLVRVTGSTVCGSDLHLLHGVILQLAKGDVLGHEFCGVVEALGAEAERAGKIKVGDRVVASFQVACGDCFFCRQKLSSQCEKTNANTTAQGMYGGRTAGMLGYSHFTGGFAGGQAEYVRMPFGDVNLLKLPDDVPDEKGLFLSDILCTAYNCVVDTGVSKDDIVAIWGAGAIGQMATTFSFLVGAKRVILIDPVQWRLNYVQKHNPKVETLNPDELKKAGSSVYKKLREMTDGRGPDDALECAAGEYAMGLMHKAEMALGLETDTSEIVNEMIESVRNYGRCGITGVYVGFVSLVLLYRLNEFVSDVNRQITSTLAH